MTKTTTSNILTSPSELISPSGKQGYPSPPHTPHSSTTVEPPGIPVQSSKGVEKVSISKHPLNGSRSASQAFRVTEPPVNGFIPDTTKSDIVTATSAPEPVYCEFSTSTANRLPSLPPSPG